MVFEDQKALPCRRVVDKLQVVLAGGTLVCSHAGGGGTYVLAHRRVGATSGTTYRAVCTYMQSYCGYVGYVDTAGI